MIPPLIGFFSKLFVLFSAVQSGNNFITFIAILVSVISCVYYLKIIKVLFTRSDYLDSIKLEEEKNYMELASYNNILLGESREKKLVVYENLFLSNIHSYLISLLTFIILLFIINPSIILNSTQLLSLSQFTY